MDSGALGHPAAPVQSMSNRKVGIIGFLRFLTSDAVL